MSRFIAVMKLFFRLLLPLVLFASVIRASVYEVGGQKIEIPTPVGYVPASSSLPGYAALMQLTEDKYNDTVVLLLSGDDADALQSGKAADMTHYCLVKHSRGIGTTRITVDGFAMIKAKIKDDTAKFWANALKNGGKDNAPTDLDRLVRTSDVVPMDPHYETDSAIAYSALVKLNKGQESESVFAVTTTMLNVNGTVVSLFVFFPREGLDASAALAKDWSDAVLTFNPGTTQARPVAENPPATPQEGTDAFNWLKVLAYAVVGVSIGAVLYLLYRKYTGRKSS